MPELAAPDRSSPVSLVAITKDNLREFLRLKVAPAQERLVASNAVSIAQAHFHPEAWFRGIVPGAKAMLLSFVPGDGNPEAFYRRFGFEPTGEVDEGEHVMRLAF